MKKVSINVKTKPIKINPIPIELYGSSERYVSLEELYAILRIPTDTIGDWARRYRTFPALRTPGSIRVRVSEVEEWLKQFNPTQELE
jgi:hypothetical protein